MSKTKMRKAMPLILYGVVRDNGDICYGTVDARKVIARAWMKRNGYQKGTARIAKLKLVEAP